MEEEEAEEGAVDVVMDEEVGVDEAEGEATEGHRDRPPKDDQSTICASL